ncbi:MAG: endonuclease/exonuclease/phosphatase family protein [Gemmatimonadetes bacterium]|nr:endonuclease/exonuclease/phosphatase family protein [Gemmatimonadota bacterium]
MTSLRFLTWNMNGASGDRAKRLVELLSSEVAAGPALAALQEVKPATFRVLQASGVFDWTVFSLDIRRPGPFDRGSRKLGCVLAGRGLATLVEGGVLDRLPLPERSAVARVEWQGIEFDAISYHSLTGSGFKAGKGVAYRALLETLHGRERPMLLGLDANTPKVDHPDEARSEFWWPAHEPLVLGPRSERQHDLEDAYRLWLVNCPAERAAIEADRPDGPLAVTHRRGKANVPCRYDQIWVSPEWEVQSVRHLTEESFELGSDHAIVSAELDLR